MSLRFQPGGAALCRVLAYLGAHPAPDADRHHRQLSHARARDHHRAKGHDHEHHDETAQLGQVIDQGAIEPSAEQAAASTDLIRMLHQRVNAGGSAGVAAAIEAGHRCSVIDAFDELKAYKYSEKGERDAGEAHRIDHRRFFSEVADDQP